MENIVHVQTERVYYTKGDTKDAELLCPERYTLRSCLFYSGWNKIERYNCFASVIMDIQLLALIYLQLPRQNA